MQFSRTGLFKTVRFALTHPTEMPAPDPPKLETQETKGLVRFQVEPAKAQLTCLVLGHLQSELAQSLGQFAEKPLRILAILKRGPGTDNPSGTRKLPAPFSCDSCIRQLPSQRSGVSNHTHRPKLPPEHLSRRRRGHYASFRHQCQAHPKMRELEDWKVGRLGKPLNPWPIHTSCARA